MRPSAEPKIQVENNRLTVTKWRFVPGAETGWHQHEYDYVVIPMTTGKILIESSEGSKETEMVSGESFASLRGVEHNLINENKTDLVFVTVELK